MNQDIHAAIFERQNELLNLADQYDAAALVIRQVAKLEIALKTPNAILIDRDQKEQELKQLKQQFNDLQLIHLFAHDI